MIFENGFEVPFFIQYEAVFLSFSLCHRSESVEDAYDWFRTYAVNELS